MKILAIPQQNIFLW